MKTALQRMCACHPTSHGHTFDEFLLCDCGQTWERHQVELEECPRWARSGSRCGNGHLRVEHAVREMDKRSGREHWKCLACVALQEASKASAKTKARTEAKFAHG